MKKRLLSFVLALILLIPTNAFATGEETNASNEIITENENIEENINTTITTISNHITENELFEGAFTKSKDLIVGFLEASAKNEWLLEDNDVLSFVNPESKSIQLAITRTNIFKKLRQSNGIIRKDLKLNYDFEYMNIENNDINIRVVENVSFTIDDEFQTTSHYNNVYSIILYSNVDGELKIQEIHKLGDWFEEKYSNGYYSFESIYTELLKEIISTSEPNINKLKENPVFMENLAKNEEILLYDAANAANYALTYSGPDTSFYNENFNSYADVGGDCMNFASQSIWAGLGMDNSPNKISSGKLFKNLKEKITSDGWYKDSLAWVGVTPFQEFVQKQKDPNVDGLVTTTWEIGANQWDLNIPEEYLLGSILLVKGADESKDYGHAIVVTEVNGTTRDKIKYSGHTSNKHNRTLSQAYPNSKILVIRPIYYRSKHECIFENHYFHNFSSILGGESSKCIWCGYTKLYIKNKLPGVVKLGEEVNLLSKTNTNVFKISVKIESPDGETTWLRDSYNTNISNKKYIFEKTGLYKITVYARDINDILSINSHEESSTYTVRVQSPIEEIILPFKEILTPEDDNNTNIFEEILNIASF